MAIRPYNIALARSWFSNLKTAVKAFQSVKTDFSY